MSLVCKELSETLHNSLDYVLIAGYPPISHLALHHLHPLHSHHPQPVVDSNAALCLHLLHDNVQQYECPSAAHSCTAVDQQWLWLGDRVQFTEVVDEGYERYDVLGDSMIRPSCVVQVTDCHILGIRFCDL